MTAALLGPLFYRRWFSREPIDAKFLDMIIRGALADLHQDAPRPSGSRINGGPQQRWR